MAQWMKVILLVAALPAHVSSRRVERSSKSLSMAHTMDSTTMCPLPDETTAALKEWLNPSFDKASKTYGQKYRYVIMEMPKMIAQTAPADKNYADFIEHMKQCNGVCIGAYLFTYGAKRSKPILFTWAPDTPRTDFQKTRDYGKLKMQLSWCKKAVQTNGLDDGVGVWIQANDDDELSPEEVVLNIPGMGGPGIKNLNTEGNELYSEVKKEMESGSSGVPPPLMEAPVDKEAEHPKFQPTETESSTVGPPKAVVSQEEINEMVTDAFAEERGNVIKWAEEAAKAAVTDEVVATAKKAAKETVAAAFKDFAQKLE